MTTLQTTRVQAPADGPANLWQAFERVVAAAPAAPALALDECAVTFEELEHDAVLYAAWLASCGIGRGDVVAIHAGKSRAVYALWLAALRQGAIYSFLDPASPTSRTVAIVDRLAPALLVSSADARNPWGRTVPLAELAHACSAVRSGLPPPADVHPLSPAYVMFTSGSTGEPKGATIAHQGVLNLMRWVRNWIPDPAQERFANLNPLHFDNSVFDLYCGLLNGATLVPIDTAAHHNPINWVKALRSGRATIAFAVPTLFVTLGRLRLLTPESLPDIRMFLFGGEGFPIDALTRFYAAFRGRARLVNVYGPTETSCICSSLEIDDLALQEAGAGFASLGRMHDGFEHAILDDQQQVVAAGAVGELWIGGANVGLGYFANPEETGRRFQQDPCQQRYRSIWYRSGDLVREDASGRLWFQGRADNQVKIRGHRIELEEIDLAIEAIPGVTRAVAAVVTGADGAEIRAAFSGAEPIPPDVVRARCAASLPAYMLPARVVQLDELPQNANGKVDRRAARVLLERLD